MFGDVARKINEEFEEEEQKEEPGIPKRKVRRKKKYYSKTENDYAKLVAKSERSFRRVYRSIAGLDFTIHPIRFLYRIHFFKMLGGILCVLTWTAVLGGAVYLCLMTIAYTGYEAAHGQGSLKIPGVAKLCHDVEGSTSGLGAADPLTKSGKFGGISTPLFAISLLAMWYAIKFGFVGLGMLCSVGMWIRDLMDNYGITEKGIPGALALIALGGFIMFAL